MVLERRCLVEIFPSRSEGRLLDLRGQPLIALSALRGRIRVVPRFSVPS